MPPTKRKTVISLDTETDGVDLHHGAKPFFVTFGLGSGDVAWHEWDVNPETRDVAFPPEDLAEIQRRIDGADEIVLQNSKFDVAALRVAFDRPGIEPLRWDWGKVRDTLIAGHLLASNHPHDLTSMCVEYLGINIQRHEDALEAATKEAVKAAKREFPSWRFAAKGLPEMPSAKEKVWRFDSWVPRVFAEAAGLEEEHPWRSVLAEYANADSAATLALWHVQEQLMRDRGLWKIFMRCMRKPWVASVMEGNGVTVSGRRLRELTERFAREAEEAKATCMSLAACDALTDLPRSGASNALKLAMFGRKFWRCDKCGQEHEDRPRDCTLCGSRDVSQRHEKSRLNLTPVSYTEKSFAPQVDKAAMDHWLATLPEDSDQWRFVASLRDYRKRTTALNYLGGYKRFWMPLVNGRPCEDWFVMHPSLNCTGTDTLRWSSSNPNSQNISKQESVNLRHCFGPAPGREWWSMDAQNIELRIPAFESGEPDLVRVFERPDDPPHFGSYHLVVFELLHPEKFAEHGKRCKAVYESTWYQWTKNGNFALIYGAQDETADAAYHVPGAREMIWRRFPRIAALSDRMLTQAERTGAVETIPDASVDPVRGYPLLCTRSERGWVLPTVPLNYHVQSTAMQWMSEAMIRCQEQLDEWRSGEGFDGKMVLQVHDELVFDFPRGRGIGPWKEHLPRADRLRQLMESCGDGIGVPTPVSVEYHAATWAEGKAVE